MLTTLRIVQDHSKPPDGWTRGRPREGGPKGDQKALAQKGREAESALDDVIPMHLTYYEHFFGMQVSIILSGRFAAMDLADLRTVAPARTDLAGIFAGFEVAAISENYLSWPAVFALTSVVTVIIAFIEVRRPSYHGVGWHKLNPRLPEWWQSAAAGGG